LDDKIHINITGTNFIQPPKPDTVATITTNSTRQQIDERVVRSHKEKLREWQETTRTDQALQQQLIPVFDKEYLRGLRNMHTGNVDVITRQMLGHHSKNYGIILAVNI